MSHPPGGWSRTGVAIALSALVLGVAAIWLLTRTPHSAVRAERESRDTGKRSATAPALAAAPEGKVEAGMPPPIFLTPILGAAAALRAIPNDAEESAVHHQASEILDQLKSQLANGDLAGSVASILAYLQTGEDAATHLEFSVAEGGALDSAPTMRTFLMDLLGTLDPVAAADFSRGLLQTSPMADPEESAMALRNLAWGDGNQLSEADRLLFSKNVDALLSSRDWAQNPTNGYLEAFDAAVFSADASHVSKLAGLLSSGNTASVSQAAFLALDRMALNADPAIIAAIADPSSPLASEPALRAGLLARADVAQAAQRTVLESYLENPAVSSAEKSAFFKAFPLRSRTDGPRLISSPTDPAATSLLQSDKEALNVLKAWQSNPVFSAIRPDIDASVNRLQQFVK